MLGYTIKVRTNALLGLYFAMTSAKLFVFVAGDVAANAFWQIENHVKLGYDCAVRVE